MQTHVRRFIISIMVNAIMWGLIFWFFFAFIFWLFWAGQEYAVAAE